MKSDGEKKDGNKKKKGEWKWGGRWRGNEVRRKCEVWNEEEGECGKYWNKGEGRGNDWRIL